MLVRSIGAMLGTATWGQRLEVDRDDGTQLLLRVAVIVVVVLVVLVVVSFIWFVC